MAWVGVDLDGTLARWGTSPRDSDVMVIGEPIPLMVARVKEWLAEGIDVRIVTARVGPCTDEEAAAASGLNEARFCELQTMLIQAWCRKFLGKALPVTATKDFHMVALYDDRAIQVQSNTGLLIEPSGPAAAPRAPKASPDTGSDIPGGGAI